MIEILEQPKAKYLRKVRVGLVLRDARGDFDGDLLETDGGFERREIRNYMKEAEIALSAGLKLIADRERTRREAERTVSGGRRVEFRILKLDA